MSAAISCSGSLPGKASSRVHPGLTVAAAARKAYTEHEHGGKMSYRYLGFGVAITLPSMVQGQTAPQADPAKAKSAKQTWTAPRTADGHPDLQGVWSNNIATPLERPKE